MIDWKRKLTSRKFWAAVADFVGMLLVALHVADDTATQITALIMAGAGVIAYIVGEGLADVANADQITFEVAGQDKPPDRDDGK